MQRLNLSPTKVDRNKITKSKIKRVIFKHVWVTRLLIILGSLALLALVFLGLFFAFRKTMLVKYYKVAYNFIFTPKDQIESLSGRVNILVLGKGGADHEAPDLTDTMILVSVPLGEGPITTVSIPRDLWIAPIRAKINSAYYWGNQKKEAGGLVMAKSTVEGAVGKRIQYGLVIDFSGFRQVIDAIGGIEVDVQNSFVDEKYPIAGKENDECAGDKTFACRYETISFKKGLQYMDGANALKFVRSRNAQGNEGTDIARAKRQEIVIAAIEKKVLNKDVLLSPKKIRALVSAVQQNTETDVDLGAASILARKAFEKRNDINSSVLPEDLLEVKQNLPQYDFLYVFVPKSGDWQQIYEWVDGLVSN